MMSPFGEDGGCHVRWMEVGDIASARSKRGGLETAQER